MRRLLFFIFPSLFISSSLIADEAKNQKIEILQEWIHVKILECKTFKKNLTDPSDIYTHYMIYGKQTAYEELLSRIDSIQKLSD